MITFRELNKNLKKYYAPNKKCSAGIFEHPMYAGNKQIKNAMRQLFVSFGAISTNKFGTH
jgi:hypothetical protein